MPTRTLNPATIQLVKSQEALRLQAYDDVNGMPLAVGEIPHGTATIGFGHTFSVKPGDTCTEVQADQWLSSDLRSAQDVVEATVKVTLSDNEYGALVSFVFNIGGSKFRSSTLLSMLNAGKYENVPVQMARWNKSRGEVTKGLVRRRVAEIALWAASPPTSFIPAVTSVVPDAPLTVSAGAPASHPTDTPANTGAGKTIAGIGISTIASTLSQTSDQLQGLVQYSHIIEVICTVVAIGAAIFAIAARLETVKKEGV